MSHFSVLSLVHNTIKLSIILINRGGIFSLDVSLKKTQHFISAGFVKKVAGLCVSQSGSKPRFKYFWFFKGCVCGGGGGALD